MSNQELVPWQSAIAKSRRKFNEINQYKAVNFDKEAMFAWQIIEKNEYLIGVANNNPESLRNAVINVAAIGISLNPAEKLAYIVPRKGAACLDVSYIGLVKLATDTGSILWARAELVHENDIFIYHGASEKPEFSTPNPFDRGEIKGVYCVAKTKEGDYLSGIMSIDEVHDIRNRSEAYKAFMSNGYQCSWTTDEGEMIKKTIIKRESKLWPKTDKTGRLDNAIDVINEHEGIDFSSQIDTKAIDFQKVEESFIEVVDIITRDSGEDDDFLRAQEIFNSLTQDEQMALNSKLQKYKPEGSRQYNTLFKEYLSYEVDLMKIDSQLVEHL